MEYVVESIGWDTSSVEELKLGGVWGMVKVMGFGEYEGWESGKLVWDKLSMMVWRMWVMSGGIGGRSGGKDEAELIMHRHLHACGNKCGKVMIAKQVWWWNDREEGMENL